MTDFVKVPDSFRVSKRSRVGKELGPLTTALMKGETVFVPFNGRTPWNVQNSIRGNLRKQGFRVHVVMTVHEGHDGVVAWAEPKDGAA